jgi:hypothetical protein
MTGPASTSPPPIGAAAARLAAELDGQFRDAVLRALGVSLDHSVESLAFVDHYLRMAAGETRLPILSLLAASAGAYYGELVRRHVGGLWIGDASDPRSLRLLLEPQFLYFAPVDQAYEAIIRVDLDDDDDPRLPEGAPLDPGFKPRPAAHHDDPASEPDETWLDARLAALPPVPEDMYYSLTGRYETLLLILELLAAKHLGEGRSPRNYGFEDYLTALAGD